MTDDAPHWFGEPSEEPTSSVDPPTVPTDWFGDIESDEFPTPASEATAAAADEAVQEKTTQPVVDRTATIATESTASEPAAEAPNEAESEPGGEPAPEMDGTRETTAAEMDANGADGGSRDGFVAWLKSLFGLG